MSKQQRAALAVCFTQDQIRRASSALREAMQIGWKLDTYTLANRILSAAIRHTDDLADLIPPNKQPHHAVSKHTLEIVGALAELDS